MVLAAGELVLMVVNATVFVAPEDEAVAGFPAIGIDCGRGEYLALADGHQRSLGAVLDDLGEDLAAPLTRGQRRSIRPKQVQDTPQLHLGNMQMSRATVFRSCSACSAQYLFVQFLKPLLFQ